MDIYEMLDEVSDDVLEHHGILGMKWGVRRYQNKDGSLTKAGKKRVSEKQSAKTIFNISITNNGKKKLSKKQKAALEKARQTKAAKKDYEAEKKRVVESGTASEVLKYKGKLSQQEMKSAMERIRWESEMTGFADKELSPGKEKVNKFMKNVDFATGHVNTAAKAWNTFANIYNAFSDPSSVSMPKIDTNITSGNKETRKKEQKEQQKAQEAKKKREEQEAQRESKQKERAAKRAKAESETVTGDVVGEGTTSKGGWWKENPKNPSDRSGIIIDAEFEETPVSNVPAVYTSSGQAYVTKFLKKKN